MACRLASLCIAALLAGCAGMGPESRRDEAAGGSCGVALSAAEGARLTLIQQTLKDGKPYAALAQLDAAGINVADADYLRAEALRRIGRDDEAAAVYRSLLATCLKGQGHHGLGLIDARAGRVQESLSHLRLAREALPLDTDVRNDLGYAELLAGDFEQARFEFLTALDLDPKDAKAAANLVLLMFRSGENDKAAGIADRFHLDAAAVEQLRRHAQALRDAVAPATSRRTP